MGATRMDVEVRGVRATKARVGRFDVQLLSFPAAHSHGAFDFEHGYAAAVVSGRLWKSFARTSWTLQPETVGLLPSGAVHATRFAPSSRTTVITLAPRDAEDEPGFADLFARLRSVRAPAATAAARRLALEVRARDESWALAAEGAALQLVAALGRIDTPAPRASRAWLADVRDLLHERSPSAPTLSELAAAAGVHPVHLARAFRREYGTTVGEYARRLRLEWASAQLAAGDLGLAEIAAGAGFADQSHFTRAFRRYSGTTPGRYRETLRGR